MHGRDGRTGNAAAVEDDDDDDGGGGDQMKNEMWQAMHLPYRHHGNCTNWPRMREKKKKRLVVVVFLVISWWTVFVVCPLAAFLGTSREIGMQLMRQAKHGLYYSMLVEDIVTLF